MIDYKTVRARKSTQGKNKVRTKKQSELATKHSKLNELTPRQTEKITAAKQTQIDGAGYESKALFTLGARARAQNAAMFRLLVPKMYVCSYSINRARAHCIQTAGIATWMHFVFDIAV